MSTANKGSKGDIGLNHILCSAYFIVNTAALVFYPICRLFLGLRQTAQSPSEDLVSIYKSLQASWLCDFKIEPAFFLLTLNFIVAGNR